MTIQTELTAEQQLERDLVKSLKSSVKLDAKDLRAEKSKIRDCQKRYESAATLQSNHVVHRQDARARLLIYGTLRGHTWDRIESNHGETTPQLTYAIMRSWQALKTSVRFPDALRECLSDKAWIA